MCISFLYVNPNPEKGGYRLILATNRDEFYERPAIPAAKDEENNIIGGKDMEHGKEGGMWLGVLTSKKLKKYIIANILSITGEKSENVSGRGIIVADYLKSPLNFDEYVKQKLESDKIFHGYNFVAVDLSAEGSFVHHHSNKPIIDSVYSGKQTLVFGNSPTFAPLTKVSEGRNTFQNLLDKNMKGDALVEELLKLLKDKKCHLPDPELQKRAPTAFEFLSSTFVAIEGGYGTRTHTVILVNYDWSLEFIEHTLKEPIDAKNPEWIVTKFGSKL